MSKLVFDSSAILTLYYSEPGKEKVRRLLDRSEPIISAVNLCEVYTKLLEDDIDAEAVRDSFSALDIEIIEFDEACAMRSAALRSATRRYGLSLGDRACLALASLEKTAAVTADRAWATLDVCKVELVR